MQPFVRYRVENGSHSGFFIGASHWGIVDNGSLQPAEGAWIDLPTAWAALVDDAGIFVIVMDTLGVYRYLNGAAKALLKDRVEEPVGKSAQEIFGREFAAERMDYAHRVLESGKPLRIRGMIGGCLITSIYRPVRTASGDMVLIVGRPSCLEAQHQAMKFDGECIHARVNDLGKLGDLTERELQLLYHIAMGRSSDEAADLMNRSTRTVEWHRASLGQKLHCENRVELARLAIGAGLTALDPAGVAALHGSSRTRRSR